MTLKIHANQIVAGCCSLSIILGASFQFQWQLSVGEIETSDFN
jgi:hypothetical protein